MTIASIDESDGALSLSIRYEGGDAEAHEIDLSQLGQSLQGMARILAVSAHFAHTRKYNKQFDTLSVKVVAEPVDEHNCYEVKAAITSLAANKELWSGLGTAVFMGVIGFVFNRRKEEELKHISEALKQSLGSNAEMQSKLLTTIEKLADALQPAVRQALAPIGLSVESINIRRHGDANAAVGLDRMTKELAATDKSTIISDAREFRGIISELDMMTGACKVALEAEPETRISSVITDPVGQRPNNPYAQAMTKLQMMRFTAKAEMDQDGDLIKLFISDLIR